MNKIKIKAKDFISHILGEHQHIALLEPNKEHIKAIKKGYMYSIDIESDDRATYCSSLTLCIISIQISQDQALIVGAIVNSNTANNADRQYLEVADRLLNHGIASGNRTSTDTSKLFGTQLVFDLREGTPVLTSKKVNVGALIKELLWFCRGETNIKTLGSKIWDQWATKDGELGPVYGAQWRYWPAFNLVDLKDEYGVKKLDFLEAKGYREIAETSDAQLVMYKKVDQLSELMNSLRTNPNDRRMLITAWNPANNPDSKMPPEENAALGMQALPPCHTIWQVGTTPIPHTERVDIYVNTICSNKKEFEQQDMEAQKEVMDVQNVPSYYLDLQLYQRSADWFIGVPFNIASYSILQQLIAHSVNMVARNFIHTFGDYHIYDNHVEQLQKQLTQKQYTLPVLKIKSQHQELADYAFEDIELVGYEHSPALTGEVAK